ncbi:hypothetical protein D3C86_2125060 [compost metagenome]
MPRVVLDGALLLERVQFDLVDRLLVGLDADPQVLEVEGKHVQGHVRDHQGASIVLRQLHESFFAVLHL